MKLLNLSQFSCYTASSVLTVVIQLISQQQQPVIKDTAVDTKATRAEAALTQLLVGEQQEVSVTLTTTFINSIETFLSNLASPDELTTDEDLQQKLMVRWCHFLPRDGMQSAVMPRCVVCPSVCL